jgi:hypothetical protein
MAGMFPNLISIEVKLECLLFTEIYQKKRGRSTSYIQKTCNIKDQGTAVSCPAQYSGDAGSNRRGET